MPTAYDGANSYPVSVTIPSDGDPKTATTVTVSLEALIDRTTWLWSMLHGINAGAILDGATFNGASHFVGAATFDAAITGTDLTLSGAANLGGLVNIGGGLTVAVWSDLQGGADIGNHLTVTGGDTDLSGPTTLRGETTVSEDEGHLIVPVGATLTVFGRIEVPAAATLAVDGIIELTGLINPTGTGGIAVRPVIGAATNHDYSIADGTHIKVPPLPDAAVIYTILSTGAYEGAHMTISNFQPPGGTFGFGCQVKINGGGAGNVMELVWNTSAPGAAYSVDLVFHAGQWMFFDGRFMPSLTG